MKKLLVPLLALFVLLSVSLNATALTPHGNGIKIRNWVSNDTEYTFSAAYKSSVWYENFSDLRLTENERNNVLRIALSQLGYHEGNSADDFNGMNSEGTENYIEYARLIVPHYNDNHYEWCACFVNWCLNQAHIDHSYGEISCQKWIDWLNPQGLYQRSLAHGGEYTPQPADFIFFRWDGNGNGNAGHIGFVLYVTDDTVYTIEGNSADQVNLKSYALNDKVILGYGTPKYVEGNEARIDYSTSKTAYTEGDYIVYDRDVTLYAEKSTDNAKCSVPYGRMVHCESFDGEWVRITYNGEEGYLNTVNLVLLQPTNNELPSVDDTTALQTEELATLPEVTTEAPEIITTESPITTDYTSPEDTSAPTETTVSLDSSVDSTASDTSACSCVEPSVSASEAFESVSSDAVVLTLPLPVIAVNAGCSSSVAALPVITLLLVGCVAIRKKKQ